MMVLATNRAEDLDSAVLDRMDESLYFGLPSPILRTSLVSNYFHVYVNRWGGKTHTVGSAACFDAGQVLCAFLSPAWIL